MSAAPDNMLATPRKIKGRINSIQERISTVRIIYTSARFWSRITILVFLSSKKAKKPNFMIQKLVPPTTKML